MFGRKKNRVVSLELNDFLVRVFIVNDGDVGNATVYEYPLPFGLVVGETIQDELAFFELLKELAKDWQIAKHDVRFFAQDHSVMMRAFEHPTDIPSEKLKGYVEMELGRTLHLPFDEPLIDVYDSKVDDGAAVIFAAPSEEVFKLMQLYADVHLHPTVLDVRPLSNIRFLDSASMFTSGKTYLIADWSINAVTVSIYSEGNVDFLRYQPTETSSRNWRYESDGKELNVFSFDGQLEDYHQSLANQVLEIERILNFYRFSLHKGERSVDKIIMMGDHPEMDFIAEQMRTAIDTPLTIIDDAFMQEKYPSFEAKHAALIGLALKGDC
ncbi:type IV pilus biogenesis protein PilM [Sporosarcina sp. NPDC096371]|uniref:type IV pilus biogenesis protein PilM n=1 Tax=Sporosarcina sp. NPDC096371 TaxID=3364530 RepID=UPI00380E2F4B